MKWLVATFVFMGLVGFQSVKAQETLYPVPACSAKIEVAHLQSADVQTAPKAQLLHDGRDEERLAKEELHCASTYYGSWKRRETLGAAGAYAMATIFYNCASDGASASRTTGLMKRLYIQAEPLTPKEREQQRIDYSSTSMPCRHR